MFTNPTEYLQAVQQDVFGYKAFRLSVDPKVAVPIREACKGIACTSWSRIYPASIARPFSSLQLACDDCVRRVFESSPVTLSPFHSGFTYNYSLLEWNKFDKERNGDQQNYGCYLPSLGYFLCPSVRYQMNNIDLTAQRDGIQLAPGMRSEVLNQLISSGYVHASGLAGFHCHKNLVYCMVQTLRRGDHAYSPHRTDMILGKVQLAGMMVEAEEGYIAEYMRINSLYALLSPEFRSLLEQALGYPKVGDLASCWGEGKEAKLFHRPSNANALAKLTPHQMHQCRVITDRMITAIRSNF